MATLRQVWSQSKAFRIILMVALIYTSIRFAAQAWLTAERILPGQSETKITPVDLQLYVDAATSLENHQPLYSPNPDRNEVYQYPPFFALTFLPFVWLLRVSPNAFISLQILIRLVAYCCLILWWERIFRRLNWKKAAEMWVWTIPLWLMFSIFWADITYMNIYLLIAFFATLLIEAILNENLGWAVLWLTILLQIKPHWAFAAVVPLLLGRWKFFFRLLIVTVVTNIAITGLFMVIVGPSYVWQQYVEYVSFLMGMSKSIPWRGPEAGFLGYNHSITQITVYLLGISGKTLLLANAIKVLLSMPLGAVCIHQLQRSIHSLKRTGQDVSKLALGLFFAVYLGVFIWMDWVWEVSLGCAIFAYLLAMLSNAKYSKVLMWFVFIPYVMIDLWQIGSYALFGAAIITPNDYILTDYSIYIPIVMIVILVFYFLLVKGLWNFPANAYIANNEKG